MKTSPNLLPDTSKALMRRSLRTRAVLSFGMLLAVVPALIIVVLACLWFAVRIEQRDLAALEAQTVGQADFRRLEESDRVVAAANADTVAARRMIDGQKKRSTVLTVVAGLVPRDALLTGLAVDDKDILTVQGVARDRDAVAAFKTALEASPCLTQVAVPLASFVRKDDVPFTVTATVAPTCL